MNEQAEILNEVYLIALMAFQHLRNVHTVNIYLPDDMVCEGHFANRLETTLMRKKSFRTYLDADNPWDDEHIQEDLDQGFMDLDVELEIWPGFTASMMRLERFSSWYTKGQRFEVRERTRKDFGDWKHLLS